jgi:hypothetical protein
MRIVIKSQRDLRDGIELVYAKFGCFAQPDARINSLGGNPVTDFIFR